MWVTSASKVAAPGIFDLRHVGLDHGLRLPELAGRQPDVERQVYAGGQPELHLAVRMRDEDTGLLAREEEQAELAVTDDGGSHGATVAAAGARRADGPRSGPGSSGSGQAGRARRNPGLDR